MDLNQIAVFANVVQAESFTAAAKKLGLPKSTVSRKISELEERLGVQLLQRSTRQLHLTDAGRAYYQYASRIVSEVEEAELAVSQLNEVPRGLLKVTAPLGMRFLGPVVRSFLRRYKEVEIEMVCTDRVVDLMSEGFDVAVRAGKLADSSLIAQRLCSLVSFLVAGPTFCKHHGTPKKPRDLQDVPCVVFGAGSARGNWTLTNGVEEVTIAVQSRLVANDFDVLLDAARAGHGVALIPIYLTDKALKRKQLVRVLPAWSSLPNPLHAVYPGARLVSPKVKRFVEHLKEELSPAPWERRK